MMAEGKQGSASKSGPGAIAKSYLLLYNTSLCLGWTLVLLGAIRYLASGSVSSDWVTCPGLFPSIRRELLLAQSAAVLEVIHIAIGIVRSNLVLTFFQVASRQFVLWGIIYAVPGVCDSIGLVLVLVAWSVTEIIRYAYYALSLLGTNLYALTWCRYTFFFILYPMGVLDVLTRRSLPTAYKNGELMLIYSAFPVVRASRMFSLDLPNQLNWSFDYYYFLIILSFLYLPIFPQLYGHMIGQRKKVLSTEKEKKE